MKQIEQLIPLVNALVYYSQIHTVTGVRAANMVDHETAWRKAQKWLWDNCNIVNGEYVLNNVQNDAVSDTTDGASTATADNQKNLGGGQQAMPKVVKLVTK